MIVDFLIVLMIMFECFIYRFDFDLILNENITLTIFI